MHWTFRQLGSSCKAVIFCRACPGYDLGRSGRRIVQAAPISAAVALSRRRRRCANASMVYLRAARKPTRGSKQFSFDFFAPRLHVVHSVWQSADRKQRDQRRRQTNERKTTDSSPVTPGSVGCTIVQYATTGSICARYSFVPSNRWSPGFVLLLQVPEPADRRFNRCWFTAQVNADKNSAMMRGRKSFSPHPDRSH
jgi:hypothetical protein